MNDDQFLSVLKARIQEQLSPILQQCSDKAFKYMQPVGICIYVRTIVVVTVENIPQ